MDAHDDVANHLYEQKIISSGEMGNINDTDNLCEKRRTLLKLIMKHIRGLTEYNLQRHFQVAKSFVKLDECCYTMHAGGLNCLFVQGIL